MSTLVETECGLDGGLPRPARFSIGRQQDLLETSHRYNRT
jgi:hypothetical protein